jgi:hypothetical protein
MARSLFRAALGWCAAACLGSQAFAAGLDRTILPIPEPQRPTYTELDVRNVKAPPRFQVKAPAGAPNVVIVLIDDMGFGVPAPSAARSAMPTLDKLAAGRPALQQLPHHGALLADPCGAQVRPQPPRRQHGLDHRDGDRLSPATPGRFPTRRAAGRDAAAQRLQHGGLRQVARDRRLGGQPSGPFDRWPTRQGFDKFYGFIGGETNQWAPFLYDGVTQVELPTTRTTTS